MTTSFKRFRASGFHDKADSDSDIAVRSSNIRARHKREAALAEKMNRDKTSALLELRDIEDELNTLKKLFSDQTSAIETMNQSYTKFMNVNSETVTINGKKLLDDALGKVREYTHHADEMIKSVKSTRDDVGLSISQHSLSLLNMSFSIELH